MVALFDTLTPGYPKLSRAGKRYARRLRDMFAGGIKVSQIAAHAAVVGRLMANKTLARVQRNTGIVP
jgi:hypothetical protein